MTAAEYEQSCKFVYAQLARFYGWTYREIEEMTNGQLCLAYKAAEGDKIDDGKLHFTSLDEWKLWRQMQGLNDG